LLVFGELFHRGQQLTGPDLQRWAGYGKRRRGDAFRGFREVGQDGLGQSLWLVPVGLRPGTAKTYLRGQERCSGVPGIMASSTTSSRR
jgi:hypothetical protein